MSLPSSQFFDAVSDEEILAMVIENPGCIKVLRAYFRAIAEQPLHDMEREICCHVTATLYGDDPNLRDALEKFIILARKTLPEKASLFSPDKTVGYSDGY